ncbi:hypothetical protein [Mucilaginibacter sp. AK015]|uniref:hypothetical protein n=1 Tax=Mucilaginibacter sp. AK015 TaxID=2723072 RepID=UPI00161A3CA0|nr:hypothetical protein [Mucilaginibacter sp. AK015]MBB5394802.1 hypothetical protein [Mucilaginibacter sp. AK015]
MSYQLEIHHVDVTGGDATFIVIRYGTAPYPVVYSILIDTGGIGNGPDKLAGYLKKYFPDVKIDLMITSHCHDDHVSGISVASTDGNCVFEPEKLCDVGYDQKDYYPATTPAYDKLLPYVSTYRTFSFKYKEKTKRLIPPFLDLELYNEDKFTGSINSISLKDTALSTNTGFYLTFWSGKGVLADGTNIIKQQSKPSKVNPNDLSISFTIHNPDTGFSYFSGGDLSGDPNLTAYHNVEGPTVDLLAKTFKKWNEDKMDYKFEIKVLKATHHGSNFNNHKRDADYADNKFNSAPGFLETLKPELVIVPCNKDLQVPGPVFIKERLAPHLEGVEKRYAYFLNEFHYPNRDRGDDQEMSDAIKALRAAAPDRTNVILNEVDNWFYTEGIGSVVVVSNSNGPADLVTPQNMSKLSETVSTNCYTVFINKEEIEATALTFRVAAPRLADRFYDFEVNENLEGKVMIRAGFLGQANEIMRELSINLSNDKILVLKRKFPALLNCFRSTEKEDVTEKSIKHYITDNLPQRLVEQMIRVFKNCYTFDFWWARNPDIPNEDFITMANLLYYNPYQYQYNYKESNYNLERQTFISLLPLEMWGKKTNEEKEQFALAIGKTLGVRPHREEELDTEEPVKKRRRTKK